jgi:hypothetical protein
MRVLAFPGSSMKNPPQNFFYKKNSKPNFFFKNNKMSRSLEGLC